MAHDFTWMDAVYHLLAASVAAGPPTPPIRIFPGILEEPLYALGLCDVVIGPRGVVGGYQTEHRDGFIHAWYNAYDPVVTRVTRIEIVGSDKVRHDDTFFTTQSALLGAESLNGGRMTALPNDPWVKGVVDAAYAIACRIAYDEHTRGGRRDALELVIRVQGELANCTLGSKDLRAVAVESLDITRTKRDVKKVDPWIVDVVNLRTKVVATEIAMTTEEFNTTFWRMMAKFGDYFPIGR